MGKAVIILGGCDKNQELILVSCRVVFLWEIWYDISIKFLHSREITGGNG